jgi:hypothetical protein
MCFSATGSFVVSGVIAGIGIASVRQEKAPSHRMLAVIPLLFAAQQVAEGVVWLTMDRPGLRVVHHAAIATFLAFALVLWPAWVPLSLRMIERSPSARSRLTVLSAMGAVVAACAAVILMRGRPEAAVVGHSLTYSYAAPGPSIVLALYLPAYVVPSLLPFFVSTMSKAKLMGVVLTVALIATFLIKREALTSVWCFFAAIFSVVVVLGISADHRLTVKVA